MRQSQEQARVLHDRFESQMTDEQKKLVWAWATMDEQGFWKKRRLLAQHRFEIAGWYRQLGLYLMV